MIIQIYLTSTFEMNLFKHGEIAPIRDHLNGKKFAQKVMISNGMKCGILSNQRKTWRCRIV